MLSRRVLRTLALTVSVPLALSLAGCSSSGSPHRSGSTASGATASRATSSGSSSSRPASSGLATIRVPGDAKTISAGVALARPGDIVLVSPGVYHETVEVKTPRVTLRGTNRNTVIIDGDVLRPNGVVLTGAGDAVQNLTVRHATLNGILVTGETDSQGNGIGKGSDGYSTKNASDFPPLKGFLVDHVTSYNNGLYGVYAFDAQNGVIENSYASGMADSGLYVGQCKPCGIAVRNNVAERNAVGYEGTNASGNMFVYGNRFVGNRVGATTDSDHQEAFVPQTGALIAGNVIAANDEVKTPEQADGGFGIGFGIAGGNDNTVAKNLIQANPVAGVEITNADDLAPNGNHVSANSFARNGIDLVFAAAPAAAGSGNCQQGNTLTSVSPRSFPSSCPTSATTRGVSAPPTHAPLGIAFTAVQAPPVLPELPAAPTAPAPSTRGLPGPVTLSAIAVPSPSLLQDQSTVRW